MCDKNNAQVQSSRDLLYSEYMDTTVAEHAVEILENKKKTKPDMHFQKSSVMEKVSKLLPLLEQSQNELSKKLSDENNIEVIEGDSFVEMYVALPKNLQGNNVVCEFGDEESCKDIIDSSTADIEQYKDEEKFVCISKTKDSVSSDEDESLEELSDDESENVCQEREQHISLIEEKD